MLSFQSREFRKFFAQLIIAAKVLAELFYAKFHICIVLTFFSLKSFSEFSRKSLRNTNEYFCKSFCSLESFRLYVDGEGVLMESS